MNEVVLEFATEILERDVVLLFHSVEIFEFLAFYRLFHKSHNHFVSKVMVLIVIVVIYDPLGQLKLTLRRKPSASMIIICDVTKLYDQIHDHKIADIEFAKHL